MQDLSFVIGTKAPELLFVELTSDNDDQQLSSILDELLTQLEMYHEYDELDDDFAETAELTLMLIYHGVQSSSTELGLSHYNK